MINGKIKNKLISRHNNAFSLNDIESTKVDSPINFDHLLRQKGKNIFKTQEVNNQHPPGDGLNSLKQSSNDE